jgi:hypothetical protein
MYREALAGAATERGCSVFWYDRERVFRDTAATLGLEEIDAFLLELGRSVGPPWQAKHKLRPQRRSPRCARHAPTGVCCAQ